jgi:hypothetical protein
MEAQRGTGGDRSVVGGHVAPPVHGGEVVQARHVSWIGCQVQRKTESLEVLPQVLGGRVAAVEVPMGTELVLNQ